MGWAPGQSGNPAGVKPGSSRQQRLLKLLEPHQEALVAKVVELALSGDMTALKLCLDKLIPNARHEVVKISLAEDASLVEQARSVLRAVSEGRLSPEAGNTLIGSIKATLEIQEGIELADVLLEWKDQKKGAGRWADVRNSST